MEERIEKAFTVPPDTPVVIRNSNGSVFVRAGSGSSGRALVKRIVEPDLPHTKYIEIEIDQGPPLVIRSSYSLSRVRASVDIEATLPPDIKALEIETINGNIVVSDMNCRIRASTSNGFIRTSGGGGPLDLHTRNGMLDVSGEAVISCLETLNGNIRADIGGISGDPATVSTVSGSILINVEDGFCADFEAVTGRGAIHIKGLDIVSPVAGPGLMRGTIGRSAGRFRASSRIGDITLTRSSRLQPQDEPGDGRAV